MGRPKQLLPLGEKPAVVRCLESIRGAGVEDIVVVVGPAGDEIVKAIEAFPVTVVRNDIPGADMAQSVRVGLDGVGSGAFGVFVCLCDYPLVRPETLVAMARFQKERPDAIVIPCYNGHNGHPTLFPRLFLDEIRTFPTLRHVIGRHREMVSVLDVDDEGTVLEMDTWEEYQRVLERVRAREGR
jgi:molybdenum cofactor cytidylyltransferase